VSGPRPLAEAFRVLTTVARNRGLRILNLAWAGSITGEYLTLTGLGVYGFGAHGAAGVGAVAVAQMLPAAFAAPFTAALGDRFRRERVLAGTEVVRALASLLAVVAVASGAGTVWVYALAGILGVSRTAYYPAQAALIPLLAREAREVTACGAAINLTKNVANLAAPALAGLLLLVWPLWSVLLAAAAAFLLGAALVALWLSSTAALRVPAAGVTRLRALSAGLRAARRGP
jgi:MFS family permease